MIEPWLGWRPWATLILSALQETRPDERMLFLMRAM